MVTRGLAQRSNVGCVLIGSDRKVHRTFDRPPTDQQPKTGLDALR